MKKERRVAGTPLQLTCPMPNLFGVFALMVAFVLAGFAFMGTTFVSLATASVFAFFTGLHFAAVLGVFVHAVFAVVLGAKGVFAGAFMIAFMVALVVADFGLSDSVGVFFCGGIVVAGSHTECKCCGKKSGK